MNTMANFNGWMNVLRFNTGSMHIGVEVACKDSAKGEIWICMFNQNASNGLLWHKTLWNDDRATLGLVKRLFVFRIGKETQRIGSAFFQFRRIVDDYIGVCWRDSSSDFLCYEGGGQHGFSVQNNTKPTKHPWIGHRNPQIVDENRTNARRFNFSFYFGR